MQSTRRVGHCSDAGWLSFPRGVAMVRRYTMRTASACLALALSVTVLLERSRAKLAQDTRNFKMIDQSTLGTRLLVRSNGPTCGLRPRRTRAAASYVQVGQTMAPLGESYVEVPEPEPGADFEIVNRAKWHERSFTH